MRERDVASFTYRQPYRVLNVFEKMTARVGELSAVCNVAEESNVTETTLCNLE